jgi:hypothetical protein
MAFKITKEILTRELSGNFGGATKIAMKDMASPSSFEIKKKTPSMYTK